MRHTEIALHRPVTTVVVFVALALMGLIASRLLPLEQFPDIEFPGIFVQIPTKVPRPRRSSASLHVPWKRRSPP